MIFGESLCESGGFWNADPILPELLHLAEVYKAVGEEWVTHYATTLAEIRAKTATTTVYGHSSQDQLATLDAYLQTLTKAGFERVAE